MFEIVKVFLNCALRKHPKSLKIFLKLSIFRDFQSKFKDSVANNFLVVSNKLGDSYQINIVSVYEFGTKKTIDFGEEVSEAIT